METNDGTSNLDHYGHFYSSRSEQFATAIPYVREGLRAGAKCVYIASDNSKSDVVDALASGGVDVESAREAGALSVRSSHDVFPDGGEATVDGFVRALRSVADEAVADGYERVRTTSEMGWATDHGVDRRTTAAFERRLNDLRPDHPWTILCQFDRTQFPSAHLDAVLGAHPRLRSGTRGRTNPSHDGPGEEEATQALEPVAEDGGDRQLRRPAGDSDGGRANALAVLRRVTARFETADAATIRSLVVEAATRVVDAPYVSLWQFESAAGRLRPEATRAEGVGDADLSDAAEEAVWEALGENDSRRVAADSTGPAVTHGEESFRACRVFPVGSDGGLVVATDEREAAVSETERSFVETLTATARTALHRADDERALEEERAEMATRSERIERLEWTMSVLRRVGRALTEASTREGTFEAVCEALAAVDPVAFVWFGRGETSAETPTPRWQAGDERSYLDAVSASASDDEPSTKAARTGEPQRVETVQAASQSSQWRIEALKRGFHSVVSLPVVYDGARYGVLSVYSHTPGTFDEETAAVFEDVADVVAHAVAGAECRQALVSERVTELELCVRDADHPVVELVSGGDAELELEGLTLDDEGRIRAFLTIRNAPPDRTHDVAARSTVVEDVSLVADDEDGALYECTLAESSMMATLVTHGVVPKGLVAKDGGARLTVHCPHERSVSELLEMFTEKYPETELAARRDRDVSPRSTRSFRDAFETAASDRQLDVLKTAYFSGYFEWPRKRTGQEVAESLGVSQPTVNRHLRAAQRTLLSKLFDEERDGFR